MMRDSKQCEFQPGGDACLVEDIGEVPLDGFFAQAKLLGDVPIAAAFHYAPHDFQFARSEPVGLALRGGQPVA